MATNEQDFRRGLFAFFNGDYEKASDYLLLAALNPGTKAEALNALGLVRLQQGRSADAKDCFCSALQVNPSLTAANFNLSRLYLDQANADAAAPILEKVIACAPDLAEAHCNLGLAYYQHKRWQEAQACFEKAIRLKPDLTEAKFNLGLLHLQHGDYESGWEYYEERVILSRTYVPPIPQWRGENLSGKKLLVYSEHRDQGFGDVIQFIRYLNPVIEQGADVTLWIPPQLSGLGFPGKESCRIHTGGQPPAGAFDFVIAVMSLPGVFNTTVDTIPCQAPYLTAGADDVERWGELFHAAPTGGLRAGLVWSGDVRHASIEPKNCELRELLPLFSEPGVRWYSLQVGPQAQELKHCAPAVVDLSERLTNFAETAAAIMQLDLVVTVDTAVAHLSAGLGKETWLLLPNLPDWRWGLDGGASPWYPAMKVFRQPDKGNWAAVVDRIRQKLSERTEMIGATKEQTGRRRTGRDRYRNPACEPLRL